MSLLMFGVNCNGQRWWQVEQLLQRSLRIISPPNNRFQNTKCFKWAVHTVFQHCRPKYLMHIPRSTERLRALHALIQCTVYAQLPQQLPRPNENHCWLLPPSSKNLKPGFRFPSELDSGEDRRRFWHNPKIGENQKWKFSFFSRK